MRSDQRIVRQFLPSGKTYEGIYEIFYDDTGPCSRAESLSTIIGPSTKDIVVLLADMRSAVERPVLIEVNEPGRRFVEEK